MRVVLDTNVLLSALLSPHGWPDAIYRAWQKDRFDHTGIPFLAGKLLIALRQMTKASALSESVCLAPTAWLHKGHTHAILSVLSDNVKKEPYAMLITKIRKQGGAAVVTLPAEVLRQMDATVGEELSVEVTQHAIIMRPARGERRRYSLGELLTGVTIQDMQDLTENSAWAREGEPVGRELL